MAGSNRFLLAGSSDMPVDVPLCLDGTLHAGEGRSTLDVQAFELQNVADAAAS